jgi:hypothetical protein
MVLSIPHLEARRLLYDFAAENWGRSINSITQIGNLPICHQLFAYLFLSSTRLKLPNDVQCLSNEKSPFSEKRPDLGKKSLLRHHGAGRPCWWLTKNDDFRRRDSRRHSGCWNG